MKVSTSVTGRFVQPTPTTLGSGTVSPLHLFEQWAQLQDYRVFCSETVVITDSQRAFIRSRCAILFRGDGTLWYSTWHFYLLRETGREQTNLCPPGTWVSACTWFEWDVPHLGHLNPGPPVGGGVWRGLGGVALSELKHGAWGGLWELKMCVSTSLCFVLAVQDEPSALRSCFHVWGLLPCFPHDILSYPSGTVSQILSSLSCLGHDIITQLQKKNQHSFQDIYWKVQTANQQWGPGNREVITSMGS